MGTGDSPDFSDATWARMSDTGVEVAATLDASGAKWFGVRNSADPSVVLSYDEAEWAAFVAGVDNGEFNVGLSDRGFGRLCRGWRDPREVNREVADRAVQDLLDALRREENATDATIAELLLVEGIGSFAAAADRLRLYAGREGSTVTPVTAHTVGARFGRIRNRFAVGYRKLARDRGIDQPPVTGLTPPQAGDRPLTSRVSHRRQRLRDMTPAELLGLDEGATVNAEVYARMVTSTVNAERVRQRKQHAAAIEMFFAVDDGDNPPAQTTIATEVGLPPAAISHTLGTARVQIARGYANLTGQRSRYAPPSAAGASPGRRDR